MAKQADRKQKTQASLLEAASRTFRAKGFHGVGIDEISKRAKATSGAFYAHLGSKKKAFIEVLKLGLQEVVDAVPIFQQEHGEHWVEAFAEYYLGEDHRNDMECGCAMTALSPDVLRADEDVKEVYEAFLSEIVSKMAEGLKGHNRDQRAWSMIHTLIGALIVSRSLSSEEAIQNSVIAAKNVCIDLSES